MPVYSLRCGKAFCGRQIAKFENREALINSGIQIMCRAHQKKIINFIHLNNSGSSNYCQAKIVELKPKAHGKKI